MPVAHEVAKLVLCIDVYSTQSAVYAAANWHAAFVFFRTAVHELSDRACACVRKWSIF